MKVCYFPWGVFSRSFQSCWLTAQGPCVCVTEQHPFGKCPNTVQTIAPFLSTEPAWRHEKRVVNRALQMDVIISDEEKIGCCFLMFHMWSRCCCCFFWAETWICLTAVVWDSKMCLRERLAGRVWACRQRLSSLLSVFFFFFFFVLETVFIWDNCARVCEWVN